MITTLTHIVYEKEKGAQTAAGKVYYEVSFICAKKEPEQMGSNYDYFCETYVLRREQRRAASHRVSFLSMKKEPE